MKRQFHQLAQKHNVTITEYKTYREPGSGGLQVFHITYQLQNGKEKQFDDSYYHLSGDAPKVLQQFEIEVISHISPK